MCSAFLWFEFSFRFCILCVLPKVSASLRAISDTAQSNSAHSEKCAVTNEIMKMRPVHLRIVENAHSHFAKSEKRSLDNLKLCNIHAYIILFLYRAFFQKNIRAFFQKHPRILPKNSRAFFQHSLEPLLTGSPWLKHRAPSLVQQIVSSKHATLITLLWKWQKIVNPRNH